MNVSEEVSTPIYIIEEDLLRRNLSLISGVAERAGVEIILAFKAFALWKTFPVFREYIDATTASSPYEARLALEEFGTPAHTYSPAYTDDNIEEIARCSSHITFNSMAQFRAYHGKAKAVNASVSCGIRVNPEYSEVETLLYNPCAPGTRFGVSADKLPEVLPEGIDGFHCHCHCESGADVFKRTLAHIEQKFSKWFPQLKWINFGGGHLMTRADYDIDLLVDILLDFRRRHPNLRVILEPGSAFAWQTGTLVSQVVDIVEDKGIKTAILNVSFTCHMPDCLEMPYQPVVRGAESLPMEKATEENTYRLGGNSCLSGDFLGAWRFARPLKVGDRVVFEDMIHYTTVKTTMFNGVEHPSIGMLKSDGELVVLRKFGYEDYKNRMN
ncbi:MAG: carboxynorspermidine decarboxylase [Prevotella sp.]|nr:carboxynorspermidine decarboxylase [Prevotella sp.]